MEIQGNLALVTGASGGLGASIARALYAKGARLLLTGRRRDALERLSAEVGGAEILVADLADPAQRDELAERASGTDIVVANAGLPAAGALTDFSTEEIDRALDVNLRAPIHLVRELLPRMLERGRGQIVLISSMSGKVPSPRLAVYAATKYGLRGFGAALRHDLAGSGVGCSVVLPGAIDDAGIWADGGIVPPKLTSPQHAAQVGTGVVTAIEKNKAEVHVAALSNRVGALMAEFAPDRFAGLSRRAGADRIAEEAAAAFKAKR